MKETVRVVVAGAWTLCVVFMFTKLGVFKGLKRKTIVEKLRLLGF